MAKFKFITPDEIKRLPKETGVYLFKNKEILYIGKSANLRERVKNHFQQPAFRDNLFINQVKKIGYIKTDSEIEALILEANLIKKYQPKYNVAWRDDKNYFYVAITKEDFPRVFITHQIKIKSQKSKVKSNFVGPFVDGKALKETLKVLRKVFPYRSCKTLPNRPCLWYHLNRCPGPCLLKSDKSSLLRSNELSARLQDEVKKVSQRNAKNLMKVLEGKKIQVLKNLKREMQKFSKNQNFEKAAKIRDQIEALKKILAHTKIFYWPETLPLNLPWQVKLSFLKKILDTKKEISRIEAYDVSNIQGKEATGSMITFINGFPEKKFYRRFKIKTTRKPNDLAMIKEILSRRFQHPEWGLPDLILIDGGKAQLNAALEIKNSKLKNEISKLKVMSLAKKENKLYIEGREKPILLKTLPREIFNLILQLRDEAHRFAISYHRKLRDIDLKKEF